MKWLPPLVIACGLVATPARAETFLGWVGVPLMGADAGTPQVSVPNVVGQASSGAADTILEGVGLDLGGVTARCSGAANNAVISQAPPAGELADLGSLVAVLTSNGVACELQGKPGVRLKGLRMPGL